MIWGCRSERAAAGCVAERCETRGGICGNSLFRRRTRDQHLGSASNEYRERLLRCREGIGLIALTVASVSVSVSGFAFIGGPGFIYAVGLGAMYIVLPAAVTNVMGAWVLAKRMRLLGEARALITIPDAIGARYRSRGAQGLSAVAILVGIVGYMATNALAMGVVINSIFGVGLGWGIWIGMGVTLAYSASGGILAGVYNDVFQGTLMAVASVLVFLLCSISGGGLGEISRTILAHDPPFLWPWGRLTPLAALSFFLYSRWASLGQPQAVHKYYMLRDPLQLKWYPLLRHWVWCSSCSCISVLELA